MSDINVIARTQIIRVDPVSGTVAVINAGPPGPIVVPAGGTSGQVLAKLSDDDFDVGWVTP